MGPMVEGVRKFDDPDLRKATRMVTNHEDDLVFGIACYEGKATGNLWDARHAGVAKTPEDAEAWLRGEDVKLLRVFGGTTEADEEGTNV